MTKIELLSIQIMKLRLQEALDESERYPERLVIALVSKTNQKKSREIKLWCARNGVLFPLKVDPQSVVDNGHCVQMIGRCANRHHSCKFAARIQFNKTDVQVKVDFFFLFRF